MRHGTAFSVLTSNIGKDYQDKILTIKSMLGHANVRTTEIYTQISPAILSKLNTEGQKQNRFAEAGRIRSETYLPPLKHQEKRGKYDR
jgi:integrase